MTKYYKKPIIGLANKHTEKDEKRAENLVERYDQRAVKQGYKGIYDLLFDYIKKEDTMNTLKTKKGFHSFDQAVRNEKKWLLLYQPFFMKTYEKFCSVKSKYMQIKDKKKAEIKKRVKRNIALLGCNSIKESLEYALSQNWGVVAWVRKISGLHNLNTLSKYYTINAEMRELLEEITANRRRLSARSRKEIVPPVTSDFEDSAFQAYKRENIKRWYAYKKEG